MFEETLAKIGNSLSKNNIPYMIIGGQAVLLYGEPRLTRDIDITLGVNTDRMNEFLAILKEISLKPLPEDLDVLVYTPEEFKNLCSNRAFFKSEIGAKGVKIYERGS